MLLILANKLLHVSKTNERSHASTKLYVCLTLSLNSHYSSEVLEQAEGIRQRVAYCHADYKWICTHTGLRVNVSLEQVNDSNLSDVT